MDISGVSRSIEPIAATMPVIPVEKAAEHREVVQAVKALNGTEMFGPENELQFQKDPRTQRMILRVVNRDTKEVLSQVPTEYVLRLVVDMKRG
jgi:flagellar protein FlaG